MSDGPTGPTPSDSHADESARRWRDDRTTFQRVYDVMTGTTDYATASDVAETADCSDDGARDALDQLVEMGIVERREGRPATYRRNDSYFRWKRIEDLATNNSVADLRARIDELVAEDERLRERFDAPGPEAVSPAAFETNDHDEIHDRWDALARWRTVRRDLEIFQRAAHRAERRGGDADDAVSV
ncbi:DUF7342 family protein [Halorussus caseinilyticus]|uniref:Helix-turn-helix domain-containing protein n=1 Tax=Halorussus caseinilyticus TaxID=3034025 RepID=A0ABD5WPD0_9EURY|nr:helix-turn-helix domain-containing protein [Halorussus sp. DT72]